jgi:hypothetical protein
LTGHGLNQGEGKPAAQDTEYKKNPYFFRPNPHPFHASFWYLAALHHSRKWPEMHPAKYDPRHGSSLLRLPVAGESPEDPR